MFDIPTIGTYWKSEQGPILKVIDVTRSSLDHEPKSELAPYIIWVSDINDVTSREMLTLIDLQERIVIDSDRINLADSVFELAEDFVKNAIKKHVEIEIIEAALEVKSLWIKIIDVSTTKFSTPKGVSLANMKVLYNNALKLKLYRMQLKKLVELNTPHKQPIGDHYYG